MCSVFERGGLPDWDAEYEDDTAQGSVPRPALQGALTALLSPQGPPASKLYGVVVGAPGTGKSVAVRTAVRAVGTSKARGAVYFLAPSGITSFSTQLMRELNYHEPFSLLSPLRSLVSEGARDPAPGQLPQPVASWRVLGPLLKAAALRFRARHGRPAVLVLDEMDLVAEAAPPFFTELQSFAKECADKGILRVVFVLSDGRGLPLLLASSARSRASRPVEVEDLSDLEAVGYLQLQGVEAGRAEALVALVAGGRLILLQQLASSLEAVETIVRVLHNRTDTEFLLAQVLPTGALFRALLERGRVRSSDALRLLEEGKIKLLLERGILAAHPDGTYTLHSRHVQTFVAAKVAAAASSTAASVQHPLR